MHKNLLFLFICKFMYKATHIFLSSKDYSAVSKLI